MGDSRKLRGAMLLTAMLAAASAAGCAGPSTRILPRESREQRREPDELPLLEEGNPFYMQEELEPLAASPRVGGSEEEKKIVRYMKQLLEDYGYEVTMQSFSWQENPEEAALSGINLEAVRKASSENADILIIAAHHDTVPYSPGAGDGAAGVAALLETARLLSRMPTDTELRFVSFSAYAKEQAGCRCYFASLTGAERARVIGAVQLDELGFGRDGGLVLGTIDGKPTFLGDSLKTTGQELLRESWPYGQRETGGHARFVQEGIPAVSLSQRLESYESGSRFDTIRTVDIERLTQVVNVLSRTVSDIMSPDTPSMLAKSRHYNDLRDRAYIQHRQTPIPFGEKPFETERRLGMRGSQTVENTDNEGNSIRAYQYPVKWFGVDQTLLTDFYYVAGELDLVSIDGDGAGVDFEEMRHRLESVYGEPAELWEGPAGTEYVWQDPVCTTLVSLSPLQDSYRLELRNYETERTLLDSYEIIPASGQNPQMGLGRREGAEQKAQDPRVNVLMAKVRQFLPLGGQAELIRADIYTDGIGGTSTSLEVLSEDDREPEAQGQPPRFVWGIDLEDALHRDGRWRHETETERQILLLCGRLFQQTGTYGDDFEKTFSEWDTSQEQVFLGVKPGDLGEPEPSFEESFLWFVLTDHPGEADGIWGARIRFFYQYEELTAYRTQIRNNLRMREF